jgi:hypothetical protein
VARERELDYSQGEAFCLACLSPKISQALKGATGGWVVVQPFADARCYVPYTLQELKEYAPWCLRLEQLLGEGGERCERCGAEVKGLSWLATTPDSSLRAMQLEGNWFNDKSAAPQCADCLTLSLITTFRGRNMRLGELVLPRAGPGAWLPWGY